MSYTAEELVKIAVNYEQLTVKALVILAKKKDEKSNSKAKGKKKMPPWLKSKDKKSDKKNKKSSEYYDALLNKYGQGAGGNPNNPFGLNPQQKPQQFGQPGYDPNNPFALNLQPAQQYGTFGKDPQYPLPINWNQQPVQQTPTPAPSVQQAPAAQPASAPKSKFPYINPIFQVMLGNNPDTALGPSTQSSLDMYKKTIGQPGINNELALEYLKNEPQYKTKSNIPFDDNANVYKVTREKAAPTLPANPNEPRKTWGV